MNSPTPVSLPSADSPRSGSARLRSLDAFRGFDIVLMFFVNLSASAVAFPAWFGHAESAGRPPAQWLADYVFPWFLFIVGVAIPFSMHSGRGAALSTGRRLAVALRRALLLYGLGLIIAVARTAKGPAGTPVTLETLLFWDILPLIGLGYFLAVLIFHTPRWMQVVFVVAVLVMKWALLTQFSSPQSGVPQGVAFTFRESLDQYIKSGQLLREFTPLDGTPRLARWLSEMFTQGLPAAATVVLGSMVGSVLRGSWSQSAKLRWLLLFGGVLTGLAWTWATFGGLAYSKNHFSSTYVLLSVGTGAIVLAVFYAVLDAWTWPRWALSLLGAGVLAGFVGYIALEHLDGDATLLHVHAAALVLGLLALLLVVWAGVDLAAQRRPMPQSAPGRASFFVVYGSNAIAVYFLAEFLWTTAWMHWRVMGPGDWGPQYAFPALQLHLGALVRPLIGDDLARGVGPWLATLVYIGLYWLFCRALWKRGLFIKV